MAKTTPESVNKNLQAELKQIRKTLWAFDDYILELRRICASCEQGHFESQVEAFKTATSLRQRLSNQESKLDPLLKRTKGSLGRLKGHPCLPRAKYEHNDLVDTLVSEWRARDRDAEAVTSKIDHLVEMWIAGIEPESNPDTSYTDCWWETSE